MRVIEDVEDIEADNDENDFAADLRKNLAKELAGPKVVNDDLKFLTKEMGIFEGRKEKSDCLQKLYNALLNISPTSVSCERVFSIAGGLIPPRRSLLGDGRFDELVFLKGYFKNFGGTDDF